MRAARSYTSTPGIGARLNIAAASPLLIAFTWMSESISVIVASCSGHSIFTFDGTTAPLRSLNTFSTHARQISLPLASLTTWPTICDSLPVAGRRFDLLPDNPSLRAYREALTEFSFARYTLNSAFLAATITALNVLLCSLGGYAFARLRFPGRELLFFVVLATLPFAFASIP